MNVTEAVMSRISVRAFLDTPVSGETLRKILEVAKYAPSGGNLQPWHIWALGGAEMTAFKALIQEKMAKTPTGEGSEFNIYPPDLKEPYKARRYKCADDMYATVGIKREDKMARLVQMAKNFDFFGAPAALFFAIDRQMGPGQWAHLGMLMQTIMLAAREQGLHTCAQEAWAIWPKTITEFFGIPPHLQFYCGMAIGYADMAQPINALRTDRAALSEFATFRGI